MTALCHNMCMSEYVMKPEAPTAERIAQLKLTTSDVSEIAMTLVDEDELAFPGSWASAGFDRGSAISEYLAEMGESA